jgi:hypothetical protein
VSALRTIIEVGPKGKKSVAVGIDWPGLERNGSTEAVVLDKLTRYLPRYARVAERAGMADAFHKQTEIEVVERYAGSGSTDFWGISYVPADVDRQEFPAEECERQLALLRACWAEFDHFAATVSAELKKGPRGGGRDRDQIIKHLLGVERDWMKGIGVETPPDAILAPDDLREYRDNVCNAIRSHRDEGKMAKTWPLRFLIRHTAYHVMDHAWEMEDKDLTADQT